MKKLILKALIILLCFFLFSCKKEDIAPTEIKSEENKTINTEAAVVEDVIKEVSFVACGDNITYGTKDARSKAYEGGRALNFKPQYAEVAEKIESADIAFINQECVMSDLHALSYYPRFNVPRELGLDLIELGYDVINVATNHMLDKGADGLQSTIDFWKEQDVLMIGGYENEEDFDKIRTLEKNGVTFAFLSYTYSTNGLTKDPSSPIVIPYIDDEDIRRQIYLARECADFVFVSVHWGNEGAFTPSDEQRRVASIMADAGADAIIGHHPHVLQPIEWIDGSAGNKTLCVFSLGNFIAEQEYAYNAVGGIVELKITQKNDEKPIIEDVIFNPTVCHFSGDFYTNVVYYIEDYTEALASVHGVRTYYGNRISLETLVEYAKTIDEDFLTKDVVEVFNSY